MDDLVFAYYCSGHGYGHATRVSAFARHLLSLSLPRRLTIHIVSSAPRHVFADSIACGALYRYANIDPVIVQPLAYRVDRQKSVQVLQDFLANKDAMLDRERFWLIEIGATCVLSDAAFLGCLAAKSAGIPSILITNFTFDSVYSYLATSLVDSPAQVATTLTPSSSTLSPSPTDSSISSTNSDQLLPDVPIPDSTLAPLVSQLHEGYQHADLLLRLPGHIPIPSFLSQLNLPSSQWVDPIVNKFYPHVTNDLLSPLNVDTPLLPSQPFPHTTPTTKLSVTIPRTARAAPLLVRPPSSNIYTPEGRANFLSKTGLPNFNGMKILIVSFGGQVFKRPGNSRTNSRTNSRLQSRFGSQEALADTAARGSELRPSSKRSSRDYQLGHNRSSANMDKLALKPRDINTASLRTAFKGYHHGFRLDLDAIDKGLRTHIKSKSSDNAKQHAGRAKLAPHSDENALDYTSSDTDNTTSGGMSSHPESDHESATTTTITTPVQPLFPSSSSNTGNIGEESFTSRNAATPLSKRRHTLPRGGNDLNSDYHRRRLATPSHLLIPGAPPASKPVNTILRTPSLGGVKSSTAPSAAGVQIVPDMCIIPPTPQPHGTIPNAHPNAAMAKTPGAALMMVKGIGVNMKPRAGLNLTTTTLTMTASEATTCTTTPTVASEGEDATTTLETNITDTLGDDDENDNAEEGSLLPDESWIAVICGVSKEQWNAENEGDGGLPEGFYVAPRDVYMPDLIAVGDVVLGKLGYGMTSECVDACTPFVYVSRPLFIEEHGLKMYLNQEGVGIELSRSSYESGEWAKSVEEAYSKGRKMKETKRGKEFEFYMGLSSADGNSSKKAEEEKGGWGRLSERERQGREMARDVVEWVDDVRGIMLQQKYQQQQQVVTAHSRDIVAAMTLGELNVPVPVPPTVLLVEPPVAAEAKGIVVA